MNRREAIQRTALVLGYAISAPALAAVLNGCKAAPELNYKPVFFTEDQARLVSELAEIILPKSDTPGAKDVGVPSFIDLVLKDTYAQKDKDRYLKGLAEFEELATKNFGDSFIDLDPEKQKEHVKAVHDQAVEAGRKGEFKKEERPFILMTKELTLLGFFTSEPGATQVLQYEPVPGAYHGCIPIAEAGNGKQWATS
jgi:gluconate 2-dehydrogenase gamma chain